MPPVLLESAVLELQRGSRPPGTPKGSQHEALHSSSPIGIRVRFARLGDGDRCTKDAWEGDTEG